MSHDQLVMRLFNWGRWGRTDDGGPAGASISSLWSQWVPTKGWDSGWGDPEPSADDLQPRVDDFDAEVVDGYVRQLSRTPRAVLVRRFVLLIRTSWREVDPAVRALQDCMDANQKAVREMERRLRA